VARPRIYLKTLGHVLSELGRQYRRADRGELPWQDAAAAGRVLRELRLILEANALEERIVEIETALQAQGFTLPRGRPNGLGSRIH
jgi:hypothetical protein